MFWIGVQYSIVPQLCLCTALPPPDRSRRIFTSNSFQYREPLPGSRPLAAKESVKRRWGRAVLRLPGMGSRSSVAHVLYVFVLDADTERSSAGGDTSESTRGEEGDWKEGLTLSDVQISFIALLGPFFFFGSSCVLIYHFLLPPLNLFRFVSLKLPLVYSVNVKPERLVNGVACGDVLVPAFHVSHLSES